MNTSALAPIANRLMGATPAATDFLSVDTAGINTSNAFHSRTEYNTWNKFTEDYS